jgi:hypothetical protein
MTYTLGWREYLLVPDHVLFMAWSYSFSRKAVTNKIVLYSLVVF